MVFSITVTSRPFSYVLICYSYPPVLGGSEIEAQRVSAALQQRGHRARIVCAGGAPMPDVRNWIDPCGLSVRIIGGGWPARLRGYVFALGVAWTLIRERNNYEVAYFLMQGFHLVTGLPVARMLGKPIVMKFSCSSLVKQMSESLTGRVSLRFLKWWASSILVLNPGMVEEAKEAGVNLDRVGWMPNPVDTEEFSPCDDQDRFKIRASLGLASDVPAAVFVGRLDTQKELPWLVGAFAKVVRESPEAVLTLVGDGPLRNQISDLVVSLGLEKNVRFAGRLDSKGVLSWLRAADVFLLISAIEGLPCSVLEAMSAGTPCVLSDIPAHTQLVEHEVDGVITKLGDQDSIAQGVLKLFRDPAGRRRMGAAARRKMIDRFSTERVIAYYETLFSRLTQA
jgi:glycosyltransferase involved in cell wall biosynthesis